MVTIMDEMIGDVINVLKENVYINNWNNSDWNNTQNISIWDNTLVIFTTDNGAPTRPRFSGSNYPLRGAKDSLWEGGVRVVSFINGGILPQHRRGKIEDGYINVVDWLPTLSSFAGFNATNVTINQIDGYKLDGIDMKDVIMNGSESKREWILHNVDKYNCSNTSKCLCGAITYVPFFVFRLDWYVDMYDLMTIRAFIF